MWSGGLGDVFKCQVSLGLRPPSADAALEPFLQKQPASGPDGPASGSTLGAISASDLQGSPAGAVVVVTRPSDASIEVRPSVSDVGSYSRLIDLCITQL